MPKGQIQRIQDCVHGLMEFVGLEGVVVDLLRTPELQRLRRIRQMGLAYQVFPGAEHSRLAHALGASYLAIKFGRHLEAAVRDFLIEPLRPNPEAIRDLAVAALCHDLGHGPLSHAWEREVIGEDYDRPQWINALGLTDEADLVRDAKWHELVGHGLLAWPEGKLHLLLEEDEQGFSKRLRYLLRGTYHIPYLPRLLSSDIDVDRADFLQRDAHQCGVAYGRYDVGWLISTSTVGVSSTGNLVVGFDLRKAPRVVEQFLVARNALYETAYFHKTVRSAEGMVGLLLRRLKDLAGTDTLTPGGKFIDPYLILLRGGVLGPDQLLALDDYSLMLLIDFVASDGEMDLTARDIAQRILARDLFKMVPVGSDRISQFLMNPDGFAQMFRAIEAFCPGRPEFYVHVDRAPYAMFSSKDLELGYFIDLASESRSATQMRHHPMFGRAAEEARETVRLFTIREGVDALRRLIG